MRSWCRAEGRTGGRTEGAAVVRSRPYFSHIRTFDLPIALRKGSEFGGIVNSPGSSIRHVTCYVYVCFERGRDFDKLGY